MFSLFGKKFIDFTGENSTEEIKSKNIWEPNFTEPKKINCKKQKQTTKNKILVTLKIIKYMY